MNNYESLDIYTEINKDRNIIFLGGKYIERRIRKADSVEIW
jgi:hypothetical protein